jgi:hypothetical protein
MATPPPQTLSAEQVERQAEIMSQMLMRRLQEMEADYERTLRATRAEPLREEPLALGGDGEEPEQEAPAHDTEPKQEPEPAPAEAARAEALPVFAAPLAADSLATIRAGMAELSLRVPEWAKRMPESEWIDRLRRGLSVVPGAEGAHADAGADGDARRAKEKKKQKRKQRDKKRRAAAAASQRQEAAPQTGPPS